MWESIDPEMESIGENTLQCHCMHWKSVSCDAKILQNMFERLNRWILTGLSGTPVDIQCILCPQLTHHVLHVLNGDGEQLSGENKNMSLVLILVLVCRLQESSQSKFYISHSITLERFLPKKDSHQRKILTKERFLPKKDSYHKNNLKKSSIWKCSVVWFIFLCENMLLIWVKNEL